VFGFNSTRFVQCLPNRFGVRLVYLPRQPPYLPTRKPKWIAAGGVTKTFRHGKVSFSKFETNFRVFVALHALYSSVAAATAANEHYFNQAFYFSQFLIFLFRFLHTHTRALLWFRH